MQIRPTAFTIGLIIYFSIALFLVYTEFGIDSYIVGINIPKRYSRHLDVLEREIY